MDLVALAVAKPFLGGQLDLPGLVIESLQRVAATIPLVEVADEIEGIGGWGGLTADERTCVAQRSSGQPVETEVKVTIRPL
jgi:hypothetical protein